VDYRPHKLFFFLTVRGEKASASSVAASKILEAFYFNPLDSHVGFYCRERFYISKKVRFSVNKKNQNGGWL
jgi:hypothetical protein